MKTLTGIAGLIVSLVFWFAEVSAVGVWLHLAERIAELERYLGYRFYLAVRFPVLPTTWAFSFLYLVVFAF